MTDPLSSSLFNTFQFIELNEFTGYSPSTKGTTQKHKKITAERCDKFISTEFFNKDINLTSQLYDPRYKINANDNSHSLELSVFSLPPPPPISPANQSSLLLQVPVPRTDPIFYNVSFDEMQHLSNSGNQFRPCKEGSTFGPSWSTHWFRIKGTVPSTWTLNDPEQDKFVLRWLTGSEGFLYSVKGIPQQGIVDRRQNIDLPSSGEAFEFYIEMACNGMFGNGQEGAINAPNKNKQFTLSVCQIAVLQGSIYKLYHDYILINDLAKYLPEDSQRSADALYVANKICNIWDAHDRSSWVKAIDVAQKFLYTNSTSYSNTDHEIVAVAHCHIDTAWLWPYRETRRKCGRSWASQIRLIEKFPNTIRFVCSQAQQYVWLKQDYPELYKQIIAMAKSDKFLPIGGTWVEMDANLPSGESFVRQFFYGQQFFHSEFGSVCTVFWLPDTFGYSSQLPQILKKAGAEYFFTQKMSWNNVNKFPHSTFYWQGLDGTKVLAHFSPANTYTSQANVKEVLFCVSNNKDKDRAPISLLVYGDGDGGGGATPAMLESLSRMQKGIHGLPKVTGNKTPNDFFQQLSDSAHDLPVWNGELYLEFHRGTYTSQAHTKRNNRVCEFLLCQTEALYAVSTFVNEFCKTEYPFTMIDECWKIVLLNQFHDVLPGSSINRVYRDTDDLYNRVIGNLKELQTKRLACLLNQAQGSKAGHDVVLFWNTLAFTRADKYSYARLEDADGLEVYQQGMDPFTKNPIVITPIVNTGVSGYSIYSSIKRKDWQADDQLSIRIDNASGVILMQNSYVLITIDWYGRISSYWDKHRQIELVAPGCFLNTIKLYEDVPLYWDAWDVEIYHLEKGKTLLAPTGKCTIQETGPLQVSCLIELPISNSSVMTTSVQLTGYSRLITFDCQVDWHEKHHILKAEFDTVIQTDFATCDTQFGTLKRPTTRNQSWEMAKFEVCAHRFVDISEFGYGAALFSDSKYGFCVQPMGSLSISLLRGPTAPDAECDMGVHRFKYGFTGHVQSNWQDAHIYQLAYQFNSCPVPFKGPRVLDVYNAMLPFELTSSTSSLFMETVKLPHADGCIGLIVRMFEAFGAHGNAVVSFKPNVLHSVIPVDLLERPIGPKCLISDYGDTYNFGFSPHEIITLLMEV